jgi:hypothetical protein
VPERDLLIDHDPKIARREVTHWLTPKLMATDDQPRRVGGRWPPSRRVKLVQGPVAHASDSAARLAPSAAPGQKRQRIADRSAVPTLLVGPSVLVLTRLPAVGTEVAAEPLPHPQVKLSHVRNGNQDSGRAPALLRG